MSANDPSPASSNPASATHDSHSADPSPPVRRSVFVQGLTALISFVLVAVPTTIGGLFFLDPLLRRKRSSAGGTDKSGAATGKDEEGYIRLEVGSDVIPADGTPVSVTVRDDFDDAWNRFVDVPVGSIWLRRNPDGSLVAFNSVCPHLGCSVNYRRGENDFFCPCHTSAFALDGTKTNQIPPRDMDSLQVALRTDGRDDPAGQEIWVKFMNFRRTTAEKIPL